MASLLASRDILSSMKVLEFIINPASVVGDTGCLVGCGVDGVGTSPRSAPVGLSSPGVGEGADTSGMTPPKKASNTLLKLALRSSPPSNAPVPQG